MREDNDPKITKDIAFITGQNAEGHRLVTRIQGTDEKPTRLMMGELRPVQDGVPLTGELVRLERSADGSHYKVETLVEDPYRKEREQARNQSRRTFGSTAKMRENWDRIFGPKPDPTEVN